MNDQTTGVPNSKFRMAWIGGEHDFCLATIGQVLEVEAKCGGPQGPIGLRAILGKLESAQWGFYDAVWPFRCGLIGGGMDPGAVEDLMKRHAYPPNPIGVFALYSIEIISRAIVGVQGDEVGKPVPDRATERESRSTASAVPLSDPSSTASGRRSTSRRAK